ncbi:MAG: adenylyltransferase/cytidyltransferase family protein [Ruminococcaceae bacterium]|nr:adenylyltransferase/cytidyltransferase family protein [Oscillospiraceae bacterium]
MKIVTVKKSDCCVYKLSKIISEGVEKALLSAVLGRVFVVGNDDCYLGAYLVENCGETNAIDSLQQIPIIKSVGDLSDPSVETQAQKAFTAKNAKKQTILPVVNGKGKLIGGVFDNENSAMLFKIDCLSRLAYYEDKKIPIENFFLWGNYKRVAIWGLDELSLAFANYIRHFKSVKLLGIYENTKRREYINVDILNYEVDINFVDSLLDLTNLEADLIFVSDYTMKNIIKNLIIKEKTDLIYLSDFISKSLKSNYINSAYTHSIIEYSYKNEVEARGVEMLMVRIPTEKNMGFPEKKAQLTVENRFQWLEREWELKREDDVFIEMKNAMDDFKKNIKKDNGVVCFSDFRSDNFNFINKQRVVLNSPKEYDNTIYLVGPCLVFGFVNLDNGHFGHMLQEEINRRNLKYRVVALGNPNDSDRYYWIELLKQQNFKVGDKIFLFDQTFRMIKWDIDLFDLFNDLYKEYGDEFYYDIPAHCGKKANCRIADIICNYIEEHPECEHTSDLDSSAHTMEQTAVTEIHNQKSGLSENPQLKKYQQFIQSNAIHTMPVIGSIVMNCNPFTLGHRYLIEYAAAQVDWLYIFVVEEDKSFFKFEDRINLVKAGTEHLKNVKVLPSGQFIISAITFSEYFDKAELKGTAIDTSLDVETFGSQIAPCLDISVRFVGEEPLDPITAQYNQSMKEILPKYGVELREIPRKEINGEVISASRVRKCLDENNWDEIKKLVPETTYLFLQKNYKK